MSGTHVEIGGKIYHFELSIDAMETLEDLFSTPEKEVTFMEVLQKVMQARPKYFKRYIWAALQKHHPGTTLEETSRIIDAAGGMFALDALLGALESDAIPDAADLKALKTGAATTTNPRKAQAGRKRGGTSTSPRVGLA